MRSELLCTLAFLCGAEVALAQQAPVYPSPGYNQGYVPIYPMPQRPAAYPGYAQSGYPGYYYYPPVNYPRTYPSAGYANNYAYYPQYLNTAPSQAPSSPTSPAAEAPAESGAATKPVAPVAPELPAAADRQGVAAEPAVGFAPFHRENHDKFWVEGSSQLSWIRPQNLPGPLATTGSPQDLSPGALGQPGTAVLFGDKINFQTFSGIQMKAGLFLDPENHFSVDGAGFYLFPSHVRFQANSDAAGNPIIGRPIFNVGTNPAAPGIVPREFVEDDSFPASIFMGVPFPALFSGGIAIDAKSELYGFEVNGAYHSYTMGRLHAEALGGFRFLHLDENLLIQDHLTALLPGVLTFLGTPIPAGDQITDFDSFQTTNSFYGLQLGGRLTWEEDWFSVGVFGKVALGETQQKVIINGATSLIDPFLGTQTAVGGMLALPSNIGNRSRTVFGVVPEGGLNLKADVTRWLRLTAGYSFLYWSEVVRAGAQIDRLVNIGQIPSDNNFGLTTGPARPLFRFNEEAFWVNSFNFGVEFHY